MFYVDGDELVPLSRGGTIPPNTLVIVVPYPGDGVADVPSMDQLEANELPPGTWVYDVSLDSRVMVEVASADPDATDRDYPRADPYATLGVLRKMVVGGTVTHAQDRLERLASEASRIAAEFVPDPELPCAPIAGSPSAMKADQLTNEQDDLFYKLSDDRDLDELSEAMYEIRTVATALRYNVPVAAVRTACTRTFDTVGTQEDLTGPDVAVPEGQLYYVTQTYYNYNDSGYDLVFTDLDSVWASRQAAEARRLELALVEDFEQSGPYYGEGYTAATVGSTAVTGAVCANATAHVVIGYGRDDDTDPVHQYVAGVHTSAKEADAAQAALGTLTRNPPWYGDPERGGDLDDIAELLGVRDGYYTGSWVDLAQGLKNADPLGAKIKAEAGMAEMVGLPLGVCGRVRVNQEDETLRELGERLAAHGPFEELLDDAAARNGSTTVTGRIRRWRQRAQSRRTARAR